MSSRSAFLTVSTLYAVRMGQPSVISGADASFGSLRGPGDDQVQQSWGRGERGAQRRRVCLRRVLPVAAGYLSDAVGLTTGTSVFASVVTVLAVAGGIVGVTVRERAARPTEARAVS